jgi:hypothetical protein
MNVCYIVMETNLCRNFQDCVEYVLLPQTSYLIQIGNDTVLYVNVHAI